jgi:hypothetical protein
MPQTIAERKSKRMLKIKKIFVFYTASKQKTIGYYYTLSRLIRAYSTGEEKIYIVSINVVTLQFFSLFSFFFCGQKKMCTRIDKSTSTTRQSKIALRKKGAYSSKGTSSSNNRLYRHTPFLFFKHKKIFGFYVHNQS